MKVCLSLVLLLSLSACLKTRSELRGGTQDPARSGASGVRTASPMNQQQRAQIDSRFFEIDRDFRQLYGKIETLEKKVEDSKSVSPQALTQGTQPDSAQLAALEKRISTLEEALIALDKKMGQNSQKSSARIVFPKNKKPKGPFGRGELLYQQGRYQEAIASYDKYRKRFPRGRRYAQATLKMGICFQKLKMNKDAKVFYREVIQRYPNTRVSIRATENMKSI